MPNSNVMLRFPKDEPTTPLTMYERTMMCLRAQSAHDRGEDIIVPAGIEIVVIQPGHRSLAA